MQAKDIMTFGLSITYPNHSITQAAQMMQNADVGALPVIDGEELCGILTDRDIVIKVIANGKDPKITSVSEVMSQAVITCTPNQEIAQVVELMEDNSVRRIIVTDDQDRPVGIVSIDDLAVRCFDKELASQALHRRNEKGGVSLATARL